MKLWRYISPGYTPPSAAKKGNLFVLRERILQTMLITFCILGIPVVGLASSEQVIQGNYILPFIFTGIHLFVVLITFFREIPYQARGHLLTATVYLVALSQLFESGGLGDVRMFLVAFTALTAVLFSTRHVIWSVILSVGTVVAIGLYVSITPTPIFSVMSNLSEGSSWVTGSVTLLMINTFIAGSITTLISGLEKNLRKQADLTQSLESERDTLEDRVLERTQSMARRMVQLRTAAEISRTISRLSKPEQLLQQVVDMVKERFDLYYAGIFLLENTRQHAVLRAGTGEPGKRMIAQGHQLSVGGSSMIGWSVANRQARIALDVGAEAVRFNNPHLPLTRSELALPIIAHDVVLGAMTVQSDQPNAFDENDITVLEGIADGLAIALENDHLYNETRESLEEIRALNREYLQRVWAETVEVYGELTYDYSNPSVLEDRRALKTIQVPLVLRDEVIGEITLEVDRSELSEDETAFVSNITTQTAIALENARLLHETERRAVQEQKLNQLASRFSRALSVDEILRAAAQELGQLPAVAEVSVQLSPVNPGAKPAAFPGLAGGNGKERAA